MTVRRFTTTTRVSTRDLARGARGSVEAVTLFYHLNRTGYNGLCCFNQLGRFNVPFGRHARINYVSDFAPYRADLTGWRFMTGNMEGVPVTPSDFIHADPPYDVEFTKYSKDGFGWSYRIRTAEWLARHQGPVTLMNQTTDRIVELYTRL